MLRITNWLMNVFFIFIIFYLIYHTLYGKFNIQYLLVYSFENKLFEHQQNKIEKKIKDIEADLFALYTEKQDMTEELYFKYNPGPQGAETVIKLD